MSLNSDRLLQAWLTAHIISNRGGAYKVRSRREMLPGVELARKRRFHNHEIQPWVPQGHITQSRGPLISTMTEPAMAARIRLEEKLRGAGAGSTSTSPSNSSSRSVIHYAPFIKNNFSIFAIPISTYMLLDDRADYSSCKIVCLDNSGANIACCSSYLNLVCSCTQLTAHSIL